MNIKIATESDNRSFYFEIPTQIRKKPKLMNKRLTVTDNGALMIKKGMIPKSMIKTPSPIIGIPLFTPKTGQHCSLGCSSSCII